MKMLYTLVFASLASAASAQDYCKDIKKEITDNNTNFSFESPYSEDTPPLARVARSYSTNPEFQYDNFNIIFSIPCEFGDLLGKDKDGNEVEMEETKIVVEFDDNSRLTDDTIKIVHQSGGDGAYARVGYFPVTPQNLKSFSGHKITKFHLAKVSSDLPADQAQALEQYVKCIADERKK